jgi:phenylalanyl-tRNA synthetase beta chain
MGLFVCMCKDMGGTIYDVTMKYSDETFISPKLNPIQKKLFVSDVHRVLGIELSADEIITLLEKMCHSAQKKSNEEILVDIPSFRNDQWHAIDLVDDVVRAYGINNIPQVVPPIATEGQKLEENRFVEDITQFFVGFGFQEIRTLGVTDKKDQFEKMNMEQTDFVSLGSTAERSINMLRKNILPELLKFLSENQQATHPLRVFEIGDVIKPNESVDVKAENVIHLSLLECAQKVSFTQMKQLLESLGHVFSLDFSYEVLSHPSFIEGRCAKVLLGGNEVGVIGEIHPQVLVNWNLDYPAVAAELVVSKLL